MQTRSIFGFNPVGPVEQILGLRHPNEGIFFHGRNHPNERIFGSFTRSSTLCNLYYRIFCMSVLRGQVTLEVVFDIKIELSDLDYIYSISFQSQNASFDLMQQRRQYKLLSETSVSATRTLGKIYFEQVYLELVQLVFTSGVDIRSTCGKMLSSDLGQILISTEN